MTPKDRDRLVRSIDDHITQGRQIFPLKTGTKHALYPNYKTTRYSKTALTQAINSGQASGLGWILGPHDIVIDIDPRTAGAVKDQKVLERRLAPATGLISYTTCVLTGRGDGGCHYYMCSPTNVNPSTKYRKHIPEFPTLEIKSQSDTIVLPYSLHPLTQKPYLPHPLSPSQPATAPQWFCDALQLSTSNSPITSYTGRDYEPITPSELQALLQQLPPTEFAHNDEWLPILMASHHATEGSAEGLQVFITWSLSDPTYSDQEHTIRARWDSLDPDTDDGVTLATLNKAVSERGGRPLTPKPVLLTPRSEIEIAAELQDTVDQMTPATPGSEIEAALREALALGPLVYHTIRKSLLSTLKIPATDLNDYITRLKLQIRDEQNRRKLEAQRRLALSGQKSLSVALAETTYNKVYGSKYLIHAANQQFYSYTGTHWAVVPDNILTQNLYDTAQTLYTQYPKMQAQQVQLIDPAKTALVALTATAEDVFGFQDTPKPVINCRNGELWIDSATGHTDFRSHSATSYLLSCLSTSYDPIATCPLLDKGLLRMFAPAKDPQDLVRHIWEMIGYIAQPNKDIPAYFILHGRGENGKTHLSRIITALIGMPNILPRALNDFLGSGNAHALASLPGKLLMLDDDADIKYQLPESALKKLAETKEFEANPKFQRPFTFRATATPLILTNDWPRIRDLSHGMLRKAYIIPFRHKFSKADMIPNFAERIIKTELPGALNQAIKGLRRLRKRGHFQIPTDCQIANDEWLQLANPIVGFVDAFTKPSLNGSHIGLYELYQQYRTWCLTAGIQRPIQQSSFEMSLLQLGYDVAGEAKIRQVKGLQLKN